ncbi:hypothetical protein DFJ73DRAFT_797429 [Zopfochytrium polystomum]|nr:hypothetical protein DFJ73DRAFT_797429 [Zopfochytrium polystomum]
MIVKAGILKRAPQALVGAAAAGPWKSALEGERALFLLGNIVELSRRASAASGPNSVELSAYMPVMTELFASCRQYVSTKGSSKARFHPLFQWYSGPAVDVPSSFHDKLSLSLSYLWHRSFIKEAFQSILSYKFNTTPQPAAKKNPFAMSSRADKAEEQAVTLLAVSCTESCSLFLSMMSTIVHSKNAILNSLSWTPNLVTQLWSLLTAVPPNGLNNFLGAKNAASLPMTPLLVLYCEMMRLILFTLDDEDIHEKRKPLTPEQLTEVAQFLNTLCFNAIWNSTSTSTNSSSGSSSSAASPGTATTSYGGGGAGAGPDSTSEPTASALKLLSLLHDRWYRNPFTRRPSAATANAKPQLLRTIKKTLRPLSSSTGGGFGIGIGIGIGGGGDDDDDDARFWIQAAVAGSTFVDAVRGGQQRAVRVLNELPHCVPFGSRVEIFRALIKADRSQVAEGGVVAEIHRKRVLEDGFRQLSKLTPSQWKQTIRIKFINELGLVEIGVDQNGVFKEFLEDICKCAFAPNLSLFRTTDDGNCVPSVGSVVHDNHLQLLEFVGKVFAKALYEGIIIDIPFATFVYAKLLGRMTFLEDLPSLDPQLYKNLLFLKHYEGDSEDLGLTFTVDQEFFGSVTSQEIKPGGGAIAVTNENKYEYIHLVSDYRLNRECKKQFAAFVSGFRAIIQDRFVGFFNPAELQELMSGESGDFEVADLRAYTRYEGGYHDQHATIRYFWQAVEEMSPKEKSALLKFATSCSKPPVGGFKHLDPPFTIRFIPATGGGGGDDDNNPMANMGRVFVSMFGAGKDSTRLPTSSTCFNVLKPNPLCAGVFVFVRDPRFTRMPAAAQLPAYQNRATLKAKLLYAASSGAGFELS